MLPDSSVVSRSSKTPCQLFSSLSAINLNGTSSSPSEYGTGTSSLVLNNLTIIFFGRCPSLSLSSTHVFVTGISVNSPCL